LCFFSLMGQLSYAQYFVVVYDSVVEPEP
jgi:hypothetical protein